MNAQDGMVAPSVSDKRSPPAPGGAAAGPRSSAARTLPFSFTGTGGEYFRIWIVNLLLSIVTLGIYSAWAKVRTKNYFYRHTMLDGASFEYLADPKKILKGRLIIGGLFGVMTLAQQFSPEVYGVFLLLFTLLTPAIIVVSTAFNARYSAYQNVRFAFHGSIGGAYAAVLSGIAVTLLTLGFGFPYFQYRLARFVMPNYSYGQSRFSWSATAGGFFRIYAVALAYVLPSLLLFAYGGFRAAQSQQGHLAEPDVVTMGLLAMGGGLFYLSLLLASGHVTAQLANLVLSSTRVGPHQLESNQGAGAMIWIILSNAFLVTASLGLLAPWAKVRLYRYKLEHLRLHAQGELWTENDQLAREYGAVGDAATDLGDLDFDFGL